MENKETEIAVSVIMPAYHAKQYIRQAIDSVISQTTEQNIELIIIDDCSNDGTKEIVSNIEVPSNRAINYIENKQNLGVAESRNKGIKAANGRYVAFLDADDWWDENKLEVQLSAMQQSVEKQNFACQEPNEVVLCFTGRELMEENGSAVGKIVEVPELVTYDMMLHTNYIPCSSAMIKREVALEFPMVHDELHEDYILWLEILKKYDVALGINEPMLKSRLSIGGKSRNKIKSAKMQYGVYRYMGYSIGKSLRYMISYMINGVKKYH